MLTRNEYIRREGFLYKLITIDMIKNILLIGIVMIVMSTVPSYENNSKAANSRENAAIEEQVNGDNAFFQGIITDKVQSRYKKLHQIDSVVCSLRQIKHNP